MGSNDEFGPDTETIRAWLNKRASYAKDARVIGAPRGGGMAADPATPAAPSPADADSTTAPTRPPGPDSTGAGRSVVAALGREAAPVDTTAAGRSVVDALRAPAPAQRRDTRPRTRSDRTTPTVRSDLPTPAADSPTRVSATRASASPAAETPRVRVEPRVPTTAVPEVRAGRWTEPEEHLTAHQASTDADFPARGGARRTLSMILLASLAATAAASYVANDDRTVGTIGVAGTLGFLTLVVWAARAGCTTTKMAIRRGQLTIERAGQVEIIDIGSSFTPVAIVGEPGHRRWTVLVERTGLPLVVINSSMVDPHWFTSALYRLRPELRPGAADEVVDAEAYESV